MANIKIAGKWPQLFSKIVESGFIRVLYQSDKVNHVVHVQKGLTRNISMGYA